jgi:lipoprotein-releasing system ATP-binding protein
VTPLAEGAPALELRQVGRTFRQGGNALPVLRGVSFAIRPGEIVALVGPSGAGKSTLLHLAGLLERPDQGEVLLDGSPCGTLGDRERTALRRKHLGFVYQFHQLLPEFSALENVMLPQLIAGKRRGEARRRATELLGMVGLVPRATHRPARLSGGEQQRVAIARAIALEPKIMLFDEPTSALDPELVGSVLAVMRDLQKSGMTMVVVSHEMRFAREAAHRVVFMENGLVSDEGAPARIFGPDASPRARAFLAGISRVGEP